MAKKFKAGNYVMLKPGGIPMTVTMYARNKKIEEEEAGEDPFVYVTWNGINGKTKTAKFREDMLTFFPVPEWKGK